MLKHVALTVITAVVLVLPFPTASALGAHARHRAAARATHHANHKHKGVRHRRKAARRRRGQPGAVVRRARPPGADITSAAVLLGDSSVESQHDSLRAGEAEAFGLQAGATGLARLAHVYVSPTNAASTVIVGIYSSVPGHPGSLLSTGAAPASVGGTWTAVPVAPIELVAGSTYWLAILGEGGKLRYRDRSRGSCPSQTSAQTTLSALPASWRIGTAYSDCPP